MFLRNLVDAFFIANILAIFLEVVLQQNLFFEYLAGISSSRDVIVNSGPQDATFGRPSAFFGHSLDAAFLFGVYSIANLVSTPVRFSKNATVRICLSVLSYTAIFPTGGRSSLVTTTIVLLLYLIYSTLGSVTRGYINKAGLTFASLIGIAFFLFLLLSGVWDFSIQCWTVSNMTMVAH